MRSRGCNARPRNQAAGEAPGDRSRSRRPRYPWRGAQCPCCCTRARSPSCARSRDDTDRRPHPAGLRIGARRPDCCQRSPASDPPTGLASSRRLPRRRGKPAPSPPARATPRERIGVSTPARPRRRGRGTERAESGSARRRRTSPRSLRMRLTSHTGSRGVSSAARWPILPEARAAP